MKRNRSLGIAESVLLHEREKAVRKALLAVDDVRNLNAGLMALANTWTFPSFDETRLGETLRETEDNILSAASYLERIWQCSNSS